MAQSNKKTYIVILAVCALILFPSFAREDLLKKAQTSGIALYYDSLSQSGVLEKGGHQMSFKVGDSVALLDGQKISLVDPPLLEGGAVTVTDKFISDTLSFFWAETQVASYRVGAIIIDPGHGGKDPGASGTFGKGADKFTLKEKDVTLAVGKMLYKTLLAAYPDKKVIITREKDVFLSLGERTDIANSVSLKEGEAVLYVSVHVNASLDKKVSGYEVWYLSPGYRRTVIEKEKGEGKEGGDTLFPILNAMTEEEYTTESILIAKFIMDGLSAQVGDKSKARGIKAEEWFVVRNANMPSVLVELGFLTNEAEAKNLNSNAYLQKSAQGIYNGIADFITHFERSRGFTVGR